jgi:hypothetical protein
VRLIGRLLEQDRRGAERDEHPIGRSRAHADDLVPAVGIAFSLQRRPGRRPISSAPAADVADVDADDGEVLDTAVDRRRRVAGEAQDDRIAAPLAVKPLAGS